MPTMPSTLHDTFARTISYLRVSLTGQCNLRCLYCRPLGGAGLPSQEEVLSYEQVLRVVRVAVGLGVEKVRLTGGEPLLRPGVVGFVRELARIPGLVEVRLTTNGVLLAEMAAELYQAGIRKLNISLDSLQRQRFAEITGHDLFERVWAGIEASRRLGFSPIKLNAVAMAGVNDDELVEFARLTLSTPLNVRFIEFMPVGQAGAGQGSRYLPVSVIRERIEAALGELTPVKSAKLDGPARVFTLAGAKGSVGFISPLSEHFCATCNRLRLTAAGRLRSCLLTDQETDLAAALRAGCDDQAIAAIIRQTIRDKPQGHTLAAGQRLGSCHGEMSRIGG